MLTSPTDIIKVKSNSSFRRSWGGMSVRGADVAQLMPMGLPEEQSREALQNAVGNLELAINLLLENSGEIHNP
eukprot:CAMPEP_0172369446 /NCGR_PEP_ID=MMETSP1060-20121228/32986_1 /TAXON_ID=37318 /ORGANISM="Pseudo-nitzschia pungens, Strain cf. cingulata" /LENGTH=72 /DNA_ID=CAMNT_0013094381 /DNA_START=75 /DNA_END=291 /DNA_ORIENTATION=+